jgi:hypothetical protein
VLAGWLAGRRAAACLGPRDIEDQTEAISQVDSRQGRVFFDDLAAGRRQSARGSADVIDKELEDRRTGFSALVVQRYRTGIEPNHRIGIEHDRKAEFTRVVRFDGAKIARAANHISTGFHGAPSVEKSEYRNKQCEEGRNGVGGKAQPRGGCIGGLLETITRCSSVPGTNSIALALPLSEEA